MKTVCIVLATLFLSIAGRSQNFVFPASGRADTTLVAADGVTLVSSISSTGCLPGGSSTFVFSTAHVSAGAIYRNTRWVSGCKNSTDIIKLDFSTVNTRPLGMNFSIYDVDNGADSVSVRIYSEGALVPYTYFLYAPTYVTANGSSPAIGFNGSLNNNSLLDDNSGRIDVSTINVMIRIDSILFFKHNNSDISGNPSQSFGAFDWSASIALPVKRLSLSGKQQTSGFRFDWQVAQEEGTKEYQLHYSDDNIHFLKAGAAVEAKGTAQGFASYAVAIPFPSSSRVFYFRLAAIDGDDKKSYSNTIQLERPRTVRSKVYPTTFGNSFTIEIHTDKPSKGVVKLMTVDGRIIQQKTVTVSKGNNIIPIAVAAHTAKGSYLVTGELGQDAYFKHFLVKE